MNQYKLILKKIKPEFVSVFSKIEQADLSPEIAEAAIPAYAHGNPLVSTIFWGRLHKALALIPPGAKTLLDFGCGTGVASCAAAMAGLDVTAIDLDPRPFRIVNDHIGFPENITFIQASDDFFLSHEKQYDAILALDVFEHIENLEALLPLLQKRLKDNGALIVSLPTENRLYKLGRRLAGKKFTGAYHVSSASPIETLLRKNMHVQNAINHPIILNLFRIIRAAKRIP